jgi:hypothetical protein
MNEHTCKEIAKEDCKVYLKQDAWWLSVNNQDCTAIKFCPYCGSKLRVFQTIEDK